MSFLEYTALRIGIVPRPDRNALLWSGLQPVDSTESYVYTQKLGDHIFVLTLERSGSFSGTRDGHVLFRASGGLRVLTNLAGEVTGIWCVLSSCTTSVACSYAAARHPTFVHAARTCDHSHKRAHTGTYVFILTRSLCAVHALITGQGHC
jgi:hypothetical protein